MNENLKGRSNLELETFRREIDNELIKRESVDPDVFVQIHTSRLGCSLSLETTGFANGDAPGGGFIIGVAEIQVLKCNKHNVSSSFFGKGYVKKGGENVFMAGWGRN